MIDVCLLRLLVKSRAMRVSKNSVRSVVEVKIALFQISIYVNYLFCLQSMKIILAHFSNFFELN